MAKFWFPVLMLAYLAGNSCASFQPCEMPMEAEEIDWSRVQRSWYDVIDIPQPTTFVDCHNLVNFTATEEGVKAVFEHVTPENQRKHFAVEFSRVRPGIYIEKEEQQTDEEDGSETTNSESNDLGAEETEQEYPESVHFITDYENYFAPAFCTPEGWFVFVKSSTPEIAEEAIPEIRDLLEKHGISADLHLKKECFQLNSSN